MTFGLNTITALFLFFRSNCWECRWNEQTTMGKQRARRNITRALDKNINMTRIYLIKMSQLLINYF